MKIRNVSTSVVIFTLVMIVGPAFVANADQNEKFDHFRTRFPLVGAHETTSCEECHRGGAFEGTPTRCALCHDDSGFRAQTSRDIDHIQSTNDCDDCHLMQAWVPSRMDHGSVLGSCSVCHNGTTAEGKNQGHVISSDDCEICHNTSSWFGARFDHSGTNERCESCHEKNPGHVMSSNDCEECHNTRDWEDADFDHSMITARCDTCHQKDSDHIMSSNDCEDCHNTRDWEDAEFDHSMITEACATCHSDDLPSGHFMSMDDCSECHTTSSWSPDTFSHTSMDYPGDHAGNLDCDRCHPNNTEVVIWPRADLQPDCAGCHASNFAEHEHKNKDTNLLYTVFELRDCTTSCHVEDDGQPEHRVGSSEW